MIKRVILFFAKRTHNLQYQLLCATLYGLVSIYGVRGSVLILMKVSKMKTKKLPKKVQP